MKSIMKGQLDIFESFTGESGRVPPINWTVFSLPRRYLPDSFFDSLEDTPEKYGVDCLRSISIPTAIGSRVTAPKDLVKELGDGNEAGFDWNYLCEHLESLILFDIPAAQLNQKTDEFSQDVQIYEYDPLEPGHINRMEMNACWRLYDSVSKSLLSLTSCLLTLI